MKPSEPSLDDDVPELPMSRKVSETLTVKGVEVTTTGQARRYEAKVLRGNLQEDLKTPRHSYHQWQIPDDIPDDVAIAPNRLLHEMKQRQFQDFLEERICGQPRNFKKEIELHRRILNVSEGPGRQTSAP